MEEKDGTGYSFTCEFGYVTAIVFQIEFKNW